MGSSPASTAAATAIANVAISITQSIRATIASCFDCIEISPNNKFAFVADLGLDQVLSYKLDAAAGKLTPNDPPYAQAPAGAGPSSGATRPRP